MKILSPKNALLAQLAEQETENLRVRGSIPRESTTISFERAKRIYQKNDVSFFLLSHSVARALPLNLIERGWYYDSFISRSNQKSKKVK